MVLSRAYPLDTKLHRLAVSIPSADILSLRLHPQNIQAKYTSYCQGCLLPCNKTTFSFRALDSIV